MSGRVIPFRRRPPVVPGEPAPRGLAELARVRDQAEALVVRGLLEAHGVPAVLQSHGAPSVYPFSVGAQGEVRILVPLETLDRSRRLLARAPGRPPPRR